MLIRGDWVAVPEIQAAITITGHDIWLTAIAARTGRDPRTDMFPHLAASSVLGAYRAAMELYAQGSTARPAAIVPLIREALAAVTAGLPEPGR